MENNKDLKGFKNTAHVISVILKILLVTCIVGLVACVVGFLLTNFIPKSTLENFLTSEYMTLGVTLSGLSLKFNDISLAVSDFIKLFNVSLFAFFIIVSLFCLGLKQLIKMMSIIKNGTPFTTECSKAIKTLGFLVIISSIISPLALGLVQYTQINILNLEHILLSTSSISNVTYNLFNFDGTYVLIGFIILILGGIFEYGCYLQDEYDSTL